MGSPRPFRPLTPDPSGTRSDLAPLSPFPPDFTKRHSLTLFLRRRVRRDSEMASNFPLPIPPRTPTPPSDDGMVHAPHADAVSIDRDSLSPLKDAFPKSAVLEPVKSDRLSPTKASFSFGTGPAEDVTPTQTGSGDSPTAGPFNFNTTVMAKSPVVKSVSADGPVKIEKAYTDTNFSDRTLDNVVATNTSTAVSRIRSSSSPLHARPWLCPIHSRSRR
jgi:hypothetical protein